MKRLLLLSNSTNPGEPFLQFPQKHIQAFLGQRLRRVLFVPFAAVRLTYDAYAEAVRERFTTMGLDLTSVHTLPEPASAVRQAEAVVIGGGNTFHLLRGLIQTGLLDAIRTRVLEGAPYVGWSAGSNVACPTIKTTNDMPIVEVPTLGALGLVPFQINPHYTDVHPSNHQGETREQRIEEFLEVNPETYVVGLREGTLLQIEGDTIQFVGERTARIFRNGRPARELSAVDSFRFLLE
ncbi:MAG: dipeptidase PepE [Acidobacteriota bacterium]